MIRYLLKRLAAMIPTLLGITLITFFVISIAPGDPVQASFGTGGAGAGEGAGAGSGGGDQDRLGDAIKAKQQLLGIMAEDHSILAFTARNAKEEGLFPWDHSSRALLDEAWAREVEVVGDSLWVGDDEGRITRFSKDGTSQQQIAAFEEAIWGLAVTESLVVGSDKTGNIALFSPSGEELGRHAGDGKPVRALAIGPTAVYAASDSGVVLVLDPSSGQVQGTWRQHIGPVYAVAMLGDKVLTGGSDRRLLLTDPRSAQVLAEAPLHGGGVKAISVSPDGSFVATAADDRKIRRYPVTDGALGEPQIFEGHYKGATAVVIGNGGTPLISGSSDELLRTWDVETGEALGLATTTTGAFEDLALLDGQPVAAGKFWYKVPVWKRYLRWLGRTATLDFGRSFIDDEPVMAKIGRALPITLGLNVIAIFIIYLVSVPLGIAAAVKRGQAFDNVSSVILFAMYSLPNFWIGTMAIMFLSSARWFNVFPSGKLWTGDPWSMSYLTWLGDVGWHLVLPITVMVYAGFASLSRYVRTSMLEALSQDYVRTARAKGLAEFIVVGRHALRNALITIVTLVGNLLPRLIGGSVIVEYLFSIDGMGLLGFEAILSRDYPVIMAITTFSALLTLLGILVSDLLYGVVDPRVTVSQ